MIYFPKCEGKGGFPKAPNQIAGHILYHAYSGTGRGMAGTTHCAYSGTGRGMVGATHCAYSGTRKEMLGAKHCAYNVKGREMIGPYNVLTVKHGGGW